MYTEKSNRIIKKKVKLHPAKCFLTKSIWFIGRNFQNKDLNTQNVYLMFNFKVSKIQV